MTLRSKRDHEQTRRVALPLRSQDHVILCLIDQASKGKKYASIKVFNFSSASLVFFTSFPWKKPVSKRVEFFVLFVGTKKLIWLLSLLKFMKGVKCKNVLLKKSYKKCVTHDPSFLCNPGDPSY